MGRNLTPARGWSDPLVLAGLIGGVAGLIAFVAVEARVASPMMPLDLFKSPTFSGANLLTLLLYFLLINCAKVPTFVYFGFITKQTLWDSLWFIPLLPVGTLAGAWMHKRVPEKPFAAIMYIAAAVTAGWLVWKAM